MMELAAMIGACAIGLLTMALLLHVMLELVDRDGRDDKTDGISKGS